MPLRFEAHTYPGSGTFEKKFDIPVAMPGSAGVRELSTWSDESIMVPASFSRLDDLVTETSGSWIKVFHRGTLIDEFDASRVALTAGRPNTRTVSGPQRNGLVEGVGILPKNYPNHKEGAFDWKWGAENVLPSLDLADLGSIRAEYELYNDQTGGGTFTVTVEHGGATDTTESLDFDVTAGGLEGSVPADTGLQGLSTVNDVAVSGSGTSDDPWVITFYDPTSPTSVSVTDADGLTSTLTENEGGRLDPDPITRSKPVDAGAGSEDEHGSYGDPAVGVSTNPANLDTGADWALRVKAESRFAGSQLVVDVTPGETYSASIRVMPDTTGTFKFVIRDTFGNHIDQDGGDLTAGSYQTLSIDSMVIPANTNQVIMRVAAVDDTPANIDWFYVNWQAAELITGDPEATWTQIVRELLEEAQDRGAGSFLELDATDSADSLGTALSTMSYTQFVGDNAHLGQTLDEGAKKGFHWQVVPADEALVITPAGTTTHVIQVYKVDADEVEDLTATSGGPTVTGGGVGVTEAQVISRRIPYTTLIGLGTGNVSKEDSNSAAETALGRIERVKDVEHLGNETAVQDYLDAQFAEQALNLKAATATVLETASQIPGVDYGPGSKIWWQFPGILDKEARPVKRFSWTHGLVAQFRIEGSRILTGEAAVVSAVDMLLRKQGRRRDQKKAPSPTSLISGSGGTQGAYVTLNRASTQTIAVNGEAVGWTSLSALLNFSISLPATSVKIQQPGYYDFQVFGRWDTWLAGGSLTLNRTRGGSTTQVWPPSDNPDVWTIPTNDRLGPVTAKAIRCETGDVFELVIDHNDSSAQDLAEAYMVAELVDHFPTRPGEVLVWTEDDTHDFGEATTLSDVWIIAGGGGGGSADSSSTYRGGGGGAGGVLHLTDYTVSGTVNIVVGDGGLALANGFAGGDGGDSSFDGQTATGGGGGGGNSAPDGRDGGSGGGGAGAGSVSSGGSPTSGQGHAGGDGGSDGPSRGGGGGGGAGEAGTEGNVDGDQGGPGGDGIDLSHVVGTDHGEDGWFAGGGAGALKSGATNGFGGKGGGGDAETNGGTTAEDGQANTGGGGGGGFNSGKTGGGGSGIVIAVVSS